MLDKSRVYYKPRWCLLNGHFVTSLNDVSMKVGFHLEQCFCSCPSPLKSMLDEYYIMQSICTFKADPRARSWIEVHYDDCPNAKKGYFHRYVQEDEKEQYRREYT